MLADRLARSQGAHLSLILIVVCPVLSGCAGPRWKRDVIYSASGVVLYREHLEQDGNRALLGFSHPIDVPEDKLSWILGQLAFEEHYTFAKNENLLVFTPKEVAALAQPMGIALKALTPEERLRFLVTRSNWKDVFLATTGTSGVVFKSEEGILNIALDSIQEGIGGSQDGNPANVVFRIDPTTYTDASPMIPAHGTRIHVDPSTGQAYPRWIEVQLAEVNPPPSPRAPASGPGEKGAAPASTGGQQATATPVKEETGKEAPGTGTAKAEGEEFDVRYRQVRERLEMLKRLKADGVLTEEEYKEACQKLLTDLTAKPEK